ncbi:MAG: BatA domain-containing protein [Pseudomonadota bacterium]
MGFLAPLMLLGLAGAAIPVIIHLIGRRRAKTRKFGAVVLLIGENRRVARRHRLRELLVLALRVAACLTIALALAKPFVSCESAGPVVRRGPQAVVLVLDNSFSMGLERDGRTLFEIAKRRVKRTVDAIGSEADLALVLSAGTVAPTTASTATAASAPVAGLAAPAGPVPSGAPPEPAVRAGAGTALPIEFSRDHLRLLDAVRDAPLVLQPADNRRVLRESAMLLAQSSHQVKRIYLFSALTVGGFPAGEPPWQQGTGPELEVVDVSDGHALANAAITEVSYEPDPQVGPRGIKVAGRITNYGSEAIRDRQVSLEIDSRTVARGLVSVEAGESAVKAFSVNLAGTSTSAEVVLAIEDDALPGDDRRYLFVELKKEVRVLLINGDPSTVRHEDETFYLENALRPGDRGDSALVVSATTLDDLTELRLADFDVAFLANAGAIPGDVVPMLEQWVRAGGGLFLSVGDNVEATAFNVALSRLLPQELRSRWSAASPGTNRADQAGRAERIGRIEASHPVFAVFASFAGAGAGGGAGGGGTAALHEARFHTIFLVAPTTAVGNRRILAQFRGGAPALVEGRFGEGRVILFTSSIDRDWNDLPIHPCFLPLAQESARYLAKAPLQSSDTGLFVGAGKDIPIAPDDKRVEVTTPSSRRIVFERQSLKGRDRLGFDATSEPGFYRIATIKQSADTVASGRKSELAVNLDPRGSDTRRLDSKDLLLAGTGQTAQSAATGGRRPGQMARATRQVELWHGISIALLLFLLGESILVNVPRKQSRP